LKLGFANEILLGDFGEPWDGVHTIFFVIRKLQDLRNPESFDQQDY